jgi:hypothetical protein
MVRLAQVARILPLRPMQASIKWAHFGPTPKPSRTLRYNTDKLQNFSGIQKTAFLYMNLILWTILELLVMSRISSETPNKNSITNYPFYPSIDAC